MLLIFQVVSGAAWAVYRLMQDTPVRYTRNSNHMHKCDYCKVGDFARLSLLEMIKASVFLFRKFQIQFYVLRK